MITLLLLATLSTLAHADIPVHWNIPELKSLDQIPALLKAPRDVLELVKDKEAIKVRNCAEYLEKFKLGFEPLNNLGVAEESHYKHACFPLELLQKAKPSSSTNVRDFSFSSKSLEELPPSLGGMGGDSSYSDALALALKGGTSWKAFDPKKKVVKAKGKSLEMADDGEQIMLDVVASGDFNGDGLEDLVVNEATYAIGASFHAYNTAVLSRKDGEKRLRLVSCFGKSEFCKGDFDLKFTGCSWDTVNERMKGFTKLYKEKKFTEALKVGTTTHDECAVNLSFQRRLSLANDTAIAAHHSGNKKLCLEILNREKTEKNEALDWDLPESKAWLFNHTLCEK